MNLNVGERVRVYGWVQMHQTPYRPRYGGKATVVWISGEHIFVKFDSAINGDEDKDENHYKVDPQQCRKLKKKERRRIWINLNPSCVGVFYPGTTFEDYSCNGWKEFVEVKKK